MACKGCSVGSKDSGCGSSGGCGSGGCGSGGCNRLNTYDWLTANGITDAEQFPIYEVSFKNGSSKEFSFCEKGLFIDSGEWVVVDTGGGYDVGKVSLSGELVRLQMKKKKIHEKKVVCKIVRKAHDRDLERLEEARKLEQFTLIKARAMARSIGLDMKIGDVQYQADHRKATFFFTSDGRVDFRELIRLYARDFKVKIEMRQIGARQESARIGGIGSCGRELCCSTWLTDFKSVATTAARYQNLAINQAKLSGQCGRLKCCLNYELDMYIDALKQFPPENIPLKFEKGRAVHIKTDIFKGLMYYNYEPNGARSSMLVLEKDKVFKIIEWNKQGTFPADAEELKYKFSDENAQPEADYEDVTGAVELPDAAKKRRKKKRKGGGQKPQNSVKTTDQLGAKAPPPSITGQPPSITGQPPSVIGQPKKRYKKKRPPNRNPNNNNPDQKS
jgi:cell fate regulator YaaT (PSP1 superfamily)